MKKQSISINYNKLNNLANDKGYINLDVIFNKEEKKKNENTWELWEIGFISTKAPKGEKGNIIGNISEFRNKNTQNIEIPKIDHGEAINPDDIPF